MTFNENLRKLRKDNDFSQEYLAEKMEVSRQTISKWESGTAMPDLKKLTELAELFDVSMDYLLGTKIDTPNESEYPVDYTQYINEVVSATISAQQEANQKKTKTTIRIIAAILAMLFLVDVLLFGLSISLYSFRVETQPNYMSTSSNDYDEEDAEGDYVETKLIGIDEQNSHLLTYYFCYTPTKYSTDTKVFFSTEYATKTEKYPATEKDGKYSAEIVIDATANTPYYLNIQKDDIVERYPVDTYVVSDLIDCMTIPGVTTKEGLFNTKYTFTQNILEIFTNDLFELESATLSVACEKGYTQDLTFTQSKDDDKKVYRIAIDDFSLSKSYNITSNYITIKMTFTNGMVANFSPNNCSIEIIFPNGETIYA